MTPLFVIAFVLVFTFLLTFPEGAPRGEGTGAWASYVCVNVLIAYVIGALLYGVLTGDFDSIDPNAGQYM